MNLLLDTCALLWLAQGGGALSARAVAAIDEAGMVFISAITAFECTLKYHQRKLELPAPPQIWLNEVLSHHRVEVLPLDLETCVASAELAWHHRDPADRFIIATAKLRQLAIVTGDRSFSLYGVPLLG
jgi:PIN domain nuclease of toxin-antitoxin system